MHYELHQLAPTQTTAKTVEFELKKGDTASNPVCTDCRLHGPMRIRVTRWPDGGLDATIVEGNDDHAR